jgi:hypothetical protein
VWGPIWRCGDDRVMFSEPAGKRARQAGQATQTRSGRPAKPRRSSATRHRVLFCGFQQFLWLLNSVAKRGFDTAETAGKVERVPRRAGRGMRFGLMVCGCSLRTQQGA